MDVDREQTLSTQTDHICSNKNIISVLLCSNKNIITDIL